MSNFETMLFAESLQIKLINIAMSKTFNKNDAEDLVQQTYLKALEKKHQFSGDNIDPWVVTILKNTYKDSKKKKKEELLGDSAPDLSVHDHSDSILLERDKDKCLKELSDIEREIISLKIIVGYKELSRDLDIKEGTVRQKHARAKDKFMKCMGFLNER